MREGKKMNENSNGTKAKNIVNREFAWAIWNTLFKKKLAFTYKTTHIRTNKVQTLRVKSMHREEGEREKRAWDGVRAIECEGMKERATLFWIQTENFCALECAIWGHIRTYSFDNLADNQAQTPAKYENEAQSEKSDENFERKTKPSFQLMISKAWLTNKEKKRLCRIIYAEQKRSDRIFFIFKSRKNLVWSEMGTEVHHTYEII